jgi:hypothetical protein
MAFRLRDRNVFSRTAAGAKALRSAKWLEPGSCSPVRIPSTMRGTNAGSMTRRVSPRARPSAADSSARTTVVPTATTRPPSARARRTAAAVSGGTS